MTGSGERDRQAGLRDWAQDARVRSAACAVQAIAAAESATAIAEQVDRMIECLADRNPERAEYLAAIIATAASQRAGIADSRRGWAAGAPGGPLRPGARNEPGAAASNGLEGQLREMDIIQNRGRTAAGLVDQVVQGVFTCGLMLQDAAELTTQPEVRWRIEAAADGLDELIRVIRSALFSPADRPPSRAPGSGPDDIAS